MSNGKNMETMIRPLAPDEKRTVKRLAVRAFGLFQGSFVKPTDETFVYELSGEVVGVVVLETFRYRGGRLGGVVKWLFTDPKAQGRGAAAALVKRGVSRLEELGCDELFTTVEGFNTASSNRFADLGFEPLSPRQQLTRYGFSMLRIGPPTFHVIDLGHFLWVRPADLEGAERESSGGAGAWIVNVLVIAVLFALQRVRVGAGGELHMSMLWQMPLAIALVFGVRSVAMKLAGRAVGLDLRYRIWETGLILSALITLVFGGVFPSTGSHYPREVRWSYRSELPRLGRVGFAGAFSLLVLGWLLFAYDISGVGAGIPTVVDQALGLMVQPVMALLVFEVMLPFFPFASFNGRRVFDYNRVLWLLLAVGVVALYWVRTAL